MRQMHKTLSCWKDRYGCWLVEGIDCTAYLLIFPAPQSLLDSVTMGLDLHIMFLILACQLAFYWVLLMEGTKGLEVSRREKKHSSCCQALLTMLQHHRWLTPASGFFTTPGTSFSMPLQRYLQQWGLRFLVVPVLTMLCTLFHWAWPPSTVCTHQMMPSPQKSKRQ